MPANASPTPLPLLPPLPLPADTSTAAPLVLVLCTGNSCRSHMAEGLLRARAGHLLHVASAGSRPAGYVHPEAIAVMAELGIDIAGHRSKSLDEFRDQQVHTVITVCGRANEVCPTFPGQRFRHHWAFDDPAHATGTPDEVRAAFRRVRDEIARTFDAYAAGYAARAGRLETAENLRVAE